MEGIVGGLGALWGLLFFILVILTILLPVSVYAAQKYAYKCYVELKGVNKRLDLLRESNYRIAEMRTRQLPSIKAREAGR